MGSAQALHKHTYRSIYSAGILYLIVLVVPQIILYGMGIEDPVTFFICFVLDALLWFVFVPYVLKLPNGDRTFKGYLESIKLGVNQPWPSHLALGLLVFAAWAAGMAVPVLLAGRWAPDISTILPPESWMMLWGFKAGLFEEIAVRGVILVLLLQRHSPGKAVLYSSLLFGLGHTVTLLLGDSVPDVAVKVSGAILGGLFFGYLFIKSGSLIPGIVCHYLIDALGGLIIYPMTLPEVSFSERSAVTLAGWVLGLAAMGAVLKMLPKPAFARA